MQPLLLHPEFLVPLPVDWWYYVPFVQNHKGELDALCTAPESVWKRMIPIIQLVGPSKPAKPLRAETVGEWVKRLVPAVSGHPFYLDLNMTRINPCARVETGKGQVPALTRVYAEADNYALRFVPVVQVHNGTKEYVNLVAKAVVEHGRRLQAAQP